jgi:hypothetical protein
MSADTDDGDHRVPSQDEYEQDVADTRWIDLVDGDGSFEVREVPPLKLLRDLQKYEVESLLDAGDGGQDELKDALQNGSFGAFLQNTVLPNIVQPNCYWDDVGDGDFDLAALSPDDFMAVVAGLTGQSPDELDEQMDEKFRG